MSDITHWASTSGGVAGASVPLVQDTAKFDANSITIDSRVINMDMPRIGNIDMTGVARIPQFDGNGVGGGTVNLWGTSIIMGDVNFTPATTMFYGRGTQSLTSNGYSFNCDTATILYNHSSVFRLMDNAIFNNGVWNFGLYAGTLDLNGKVLKVAGFDGAQTAYVRSISFGSGEIWVTSAFQVHPTNMTMGANTGTIRLGDDTTTGIGFQPNGFTTYNNIIIQGSQSYTTSISGAFTCNTLTVDRSEAAKTISGAVTITLNGGLSIPVSGVTVVTITNTDWSTTAGNIVSVDYVAFSGGANTSTASATGTWYAGTHSTGTPQTNWQFVGTTAPVFTTDAASNITQTTATLNATVTSLGSWTNGVYISFDYGMTVVYSDGPTAEGAVVLAVPTSISIPVSSLNPLVDYHFRAIARYNYLDYSYGGDRTFYSDEVIPVPVPGAPLASGLSSLTGEDLSPVDIMEQTTDEDINALGTTGALTGLIGYDIIHTAAIAMTNNTTYNLAAVEMQLWYIATGFILLLIVMGLLILIPGHQMISGIGGLAFIGLAISVHIYPWWTIFVAVLYLLGTIAAERSSLSG